MYLYLYLQFLSPECEYIETAAVSETNRVANNFTEMVIFVQTLGTKIAKSRQSSTTYTQLLSFGCKKTILFQNQISSIQQFLIIRSKKLNNNNNIIQRYCALPRGLIKEHDGWVVDELERYGEPLALPAR